MAYRAALEERTRERVPLDWAMTQNNLGNAPPDARGARERHGAAGGGGRGLSRGAGGKDPRARAARLGGDAEQSRLCAPDARSARAGRRGLEEAVVAYRAALEEYTRERVPLDWAMTLGNEGVALRTIAERSKTSRSTPSGHSSKSKRHEVLSKRPDMRLTQPITPIRLSSRELWSIHCERGNE